MPPAKRVVIRCFTFRPFWAGTHGDIRGISAPAACFGPWCRLLRCSGPLARQPNDGVAEVFAATALVGKAVHRAPVQPDEDLAGLAPLNLVAHAAERQCCGDCVVGLGGNGDADQDRFRRSAMDTTSAGVGKQKDAHASMSSRRLSSESLRR